MKAFARRYGIDLSECPDLDVYRTFGEFFARPLRPGLRPVAAGRGGGGLAGRRGRLGDRASRRAGGSSRRRGSTTPPRRSSATRSSRARLEGGAYATLYLSPQGLPPHPLPARRRGHRAGATCPGRLWPVNPASVRTVPGLFAVNERLVTVMETPLGALRGRRGRRDRRRPRARLLRPVASRPPTCRAPRRAAGTTRRPLPVEKGQELGAFEMGSTVILLFEPGQGAARSPARPRRARPRRRGDRRGRLAPAPTSAHLGAIPRTCARARPRRDTLWVNISLASPRDAGTMSR